MGLLITFVKYIIATTTMAMLSFTYQDTGAIPAAFVEALSVEGLA